MLSLQSVLPWASLVLSAAASALSPDLLIVTCICIAC